MNRFLARAIRRRWQRQMDLGFMMDVDLYYLDRCEISYEWYMT